MLDLINLALVVALLAFIVAAVGMAWTGRREARKARQTLQALLDAGADAPGTEVGESSAAASPDAEKLEQLVALLEAQQRRFNTASLFRSLSPTRAWEAGARTGDRLAQRRRETGEPTGH